MSGRYFSDHFYGLRRVSIAGAMSLCLLAPLAVAQGIGVNDLGVGGVLDVPSARMPEEGTLTATYSRKDVADVYAVGYQLLPRLEASFRYTIFNAREISPIPGTRCVANASFCDGLRDRSFEVKYRLIEESSLLPEVTAGIRDIVGTGAWGAEYVVANKRYDNLDVSVGMGWGRLAERSFTRNPLTYITEKFATRVQDTGLGGEFSLTSYFRGPNVGLFGSLRYEIPEKRLALLAAYNSDSYERERRLGTIDSASPVSVGLEWEARPGVRLTASWQQGNQLALKLSASADTLTALPRKRPNGFGTNLAAPAAARTLADSVGWWPRFVNDAEASGILVFDAQIDEETTLILRYRNNAYRLEADAVQRLLTIAEIYAPAAVREIILTGMVSDYPTHSVRYRRSALDLPAVLTDPERIEVGPPVAVTNPDFTTRFPYPNAKLNYSLSPRLYFFDPEFPLLYQIVLRVGGEVDFGSGFRLVGNWSQELGGQFEKIVRGGESALPKVRSEQRRYLQEGASGIDNLVLSKRGKLGDSYHYQIMGGLLEEMYAGVAGEILWRPYDSRIAVGLSVQAVQQRDFDKMFGLRDYRIVTGHLSGYWATPLNNFDVALHAGRYLAGDIGATLEVQKRMPNGWIVGAWATITNVPFEVFGEGSFDKGLFFTVPLDFFSSNNTRDRYRSNIRIINRDGGRPVEGGVRTLWDQLRDTQIDRLDDFRGRMMPE